MRLKVFLSSTAQDLQAYRPVADDTILRLSAESIAMERFGPLPGTPVDECERQARESSGWALPATRARCGRRRATMPFR